MITVPKNISVQSFGVQDSVSFGIKEDGLAHVFGILRNQLYSDKILAVIREYSCNAVDANVENGNGERPIRVTLPNRFDSTFKVRDFGRGLTDGDIHEIYAFYGESTKRSSNKFIGQLGLGSKAAFAYGDNFVINSFVDGKKTTYNAFIDDTQIGKISKLAVEETSEENGVEIVVSVNVGDINSFITKTEEFFSYFKIKPVFVGAEISFEDKSQSETLDKSYNESLKTLGVSFRGDSWKLSMGKYVTAPCVAIMGNVGYRVNYSSLQNHNLSVQEQLFYEYVRSGGGIDLHFEIGDLEVAANREELQYTKKTVSAIFEKGAKFVTEFKEGLAKVFNDKETLVQAKKLYGCWDTSAGWGLSNLIGKEFKWNDKALLNSSIYFNFPDLEKAGVSIDCYSFSKKNNKAKRVEGNRPSVNCSNILVVNDLGTRNYLGKRLRHFSQGKTVYVFNYVDEQKLNDLLKQEKIEKSDLIMASTLPLPAGVGNHYSRPSLTATRVRKATGTVCSFNVSSSYRGYGGRPSFWSEAEIDWSQPAVYVGIEKTNMFCSFKSDSGLSFEKVVERGWDLSSLLVEVKEAGCDIPILYGIRKEKMNKALKSPLLVTFTKFVKDFLESPKNKEKVQLYIDYIKIGQMFSCFDFLNAAKNNNRAFDKDSLFLKLLEVVKKAEASTKLNQGLFRLIRGLTSENDKNVSKECLSLMERVDKAYPLLAMLHFSSYMNAANSMGDAMIHYVNGMDLAQSQVVGS